MASYTEKSSGDALAALLKMTAATCRVRRNGGGGAAASSTAAAPVDLEAGEGDGAPGDLTIASRDLVPGDLVLIESGNVIPADVRLISCQDCRVDEQMLTGESVDVSKNHLWRPSGKEELSPGNMLFSGTNMVTGRATGIVVATGMKTRIGRIAALLQDDDEDDKDEEEEEEAAATSATPADADDKEPGHRARLKRALTRQLTRSQPDFNKALPESQKISIVPHTLSRSNLASKSSRSLAKNASTAAAKDSKKKDKKGEKDAKADKPQDKKKKKGGSTALQHSLKVLGLSLSALGIVACILVFVIGIGRGYEDPSHPGEEAWLVLLLTAVSLAVSAIPEGLPVAVTVCLAMGSVRLSRAKTLVRQLPAVENLGSVTVVSAQTKTKYTRARTHSVVNGSVSHPSFFCFFFFFLSFSAAPTRPAR